MTAAPASSPPGEPGADAPDNPAGRIFTALTAVWNARRSARGFHPEPIARDELTHLLTAAQRAPSWCNVQPWHVVVTEPPVTGQLAEAMQSAARSGSPHAELPFPVEYPPPFKERRVACGAALYQAMGVARNDMAGRYDAFLRNYAFFGAPHVAIVSCDRRLGPYAYVDVGVWLGYVLSACAALRIDTCPLASVAAYPEPLRARLPIPETNIILFGLALGHADDAPANDCRTRRESIDVNVSFVD